MIRLIATSLLALALAACQSASAPAPQKAMRGESVVLGYRERVIFDERLDVQFVGIGEDSRCPRDVACFWQGQVQVLLSARLDGASATSHEVIAGESAAIDSWRLTVLDVQPERTSETQIPLEDYRILLKAE
jgi:hypothetical protein